MALTSLKFTSMLWIAIHAKGVDVKQFFNKLSICGKFPLPNLCEASHKFGASGGARGQAIFCYQLKDGKHTRFERYQVQGEVRPQFLPLWAKEKAADIRDKKETEKQHKPKDKGGR